MIQPLQYAKGWKKDGFLAITDLKGCNHKSCQQDQGTYFIKIKEEIIFEM